MELKEFMENKQIKDFTKRCLLNDNFAECRDTCLKVVEQTNNINEFITDFLDRKNLMKYQGYWELAKELGTNKLRKMAIDYLEENRKNKEINIRYAITVSDKGSIKIGNDTFSIGVSNQYGDCYDNYVYVIENNTDKINLDFAKFVMDIEGTEMYIYDYDCGNDKVIKLKNKRYGIYVLEKLIILEKWN